MFFWHDSRIHVDARGTLVIQGVAPEDAGNYSCRATNEVGTDEETVTLYYTGTWTTASLDTLLPPSCPRTLSICGISGPVGRAPHMGHKVDILVERCSTPMQGTGIPGSGAGE